MPMPDGSIFQGITGSDLVFSAGQAGHAGKKLPSFKMVAYTGKELIRFGDRLIIDLDGYEVTGNDTPIRLNHDADKGIGHATKVWVEYGQLLAEGVISRETDEAREVVASSKNHFPWQTSMGLTNTRVEFIKQGSVQVNGREFFAPGYVVRGFKLVEISITDAGVDGDTSTKIAASEKTQTHAKLEHNMPPEITPTTTTTPAATPTPPVATPAVQIAQGAGAVPAATPATPATHAAPAAAPMQLSLDQMATNAEAESNRHTRILELSQGVLNENPTLSAEVKRMGEQAIEAGTSATDYQFQMMQMSKTYPGVGMPRADHQESGDVFEAGLCISGDMSDVELASEFDEKTLNLADIRFKGSLGLGEVIDKFARANNFTGHSIRSNPDDALELAMQPTMTLAASTMSLPGILGNVANKFMARGFESVENTMNMISSSRNAKDFKRMTSFSLTGDMGYKKVAAGGELEHAKLGEVQYGNQIDTHGIQFGLDRRDVINDDLHSFTELPRMIGRGGQLTLNKVFWGIFMAGIPDAFWAVAKSNLLTGAPSALGIDALTLADTQFGEQTDPHGNPLGASPEILLVPTALKTTADQILKSTEIRDPNNKFGTANPHAGNFKRVSSSYLSNTKIHASATKTAWWLLASPGNLPTIEVAYLMGRKRPTVESAKMPIGTLGIQFQAYFDFGVELQEFRASQYNAGA